MMNALCQYFSRSSSIQGAARKCMFVKHYPQSAGFIIAERRKHWNPKFRRERGKKVLKVELPDYDELRRDEKLPVEELRTKLKEKGIVPRRTWNERPLCISCTGNVFDAYIPPEGDGKVSLSSTPGVKQRAEEWGKKGKSYLSLRKIRNFEFDFDVPKLAEQCQEIYISAHKALEVMDEDKLHELVTEKCYPEMVDNVQLKTIRWKFIQSLEMPRVVHIRHESLLAKENIFAQATVRFHTQQTLAVYDRFGRLMHGSEDTVKDVLEYVVFEKYLSDIYGQWRIHGKIIPDWESPKDPILKTSIKSRTAVHL